MRTLPIRLRLGILCLWITLSVRGETSAPAIPAAFDVEIISSSPWGRLVPKTLNNQGYGGYVLSNNTELAFIRTNNGSEPRFLGTLGGTRSDVFSWSNDKWFTGSSTDSKDIQRAFLHWGDYMEDLSFFQPTGYGASAGLSVSDYGAVTGWIEKEGVKRAFHYSQGHFTVLPEFGLSHIGYGIDDVGTVVGTAQFENGVRKGFLFRQYLGAPEYVPALGGSSSAAYAINFFNVVVGEAETSTGDFQAFLYDLVNDSMVPLGTLGGKTSKALALNRNHKVVGEACNDEGKRRAFLYADGAMADLNSRLPSGNLFILTTAFAINDRDQILAEGTYAGEAVSVLLTPQDPSANSITLKNVQLVVEDQKFLAFEFKGPEGSNYVVQACSIFPMWEHTAERGPYLASTNRVKMPITNSATFFRVLTVPRTR